MKKISLLSLICILICSVLCGCGTSVKAKELTFSGNKVSAAEAIDWLDVKAENGENQILPDRWYSVSGVVSRTEKNKDEKHSEESSVSVILTGKVLCSEDPYESKMKLKIEGKIIGKATYDRSYSEYRNRENSEDEAEINGEVIIVHGYNYTKLTVKQKDNINGTKNEKVVYASSELSEIFEQIGLGSFEFSDLDVDLDAVLDMFRSLSGSSEKDDIECRLDEKNGYVAAKYEYSNDDYASNSRRIVKEQYAVKFKNASNVVDNIEMYGYNMSNKSYSEGSAREETTVYMTIKSSSKTTVKEPKDYYRYSSGGSSSGGYGY